MDIFKASITHSQVCVEPDAIDFVYKTYIPPDDPVFELVPPEFGEIMDHIYNQIGQPTLTYENIWRVYCDILDRFTDGGILFRDEWAACIATPEQGSIQLLPNLTELPNGEPSAVAADGSYYMGGVNGGLGLGMSLNKNVLHNLSNLQTLR